MRAAVVTKVSFKCPECGVGMDIEGLCKGCRRKVVAGPVIVVNRSGRGQKYPLGPPSKSQIGQ